MALDKTPEADVELDDLYVVVTYGYFGDPSIAAGPYTARDTAVVAKGHLDDSPPICGLKGRYEVMDLDDYITARADHARREAEHG